MYVCKRFNKTLHLFEIIILYIVLCFNVGVFEVVVKVNWEFEPFPVVYCAVSNMSLIYEDRLKISQCSV